MTDLVARACDGDEDAFGDLYRAHAAVALRRRKKAAPRVALTVQD